MATIPLLALVTLQIVGDGKRTAPDVPLHG